MSLFRKAPTEAELDSVKRSITLRLEAKAKAAAEKAKAEAEAKEVAKQNLPAPKVTFTKSGFRRFSAEIAEGWRKRYERYGDPEIERLAEEKLRAALKADGYEIPERTETDPLKAALLRRQAAKG